jgi:RHS repeat-associated protein
MSQADRTIKWAARFSPFGEAGQDDVNGSVDCNPAVVENPLRFPGQYDDRRKGTGFHYYNGARYYDPAIGRYTQVDPLLPALMSVPLRGDQPEELQNLPLGYGYALSDPVSLADPDGQHDTGKCKYVGGDCDACARTAAALITDQKLKACVIAQCKRKDVKVLCDKKAKERAKCRAPAPGGGAWGGSAPIGELDRPTSRVDWCELPVSPKCQIRTMVHELAHTCGWRDGEIGKGVPPQGDC